MRSGQRQPPRHIQRERSIGLDMPIEEWGQAPIIFCSEPLQPLVVLQDLLNHERVNVLSRDFGGHLQISPVTRQMKLDTVLAFSWCLALIVAVHPHHEVVLLMENFQDHEEAMLLFVVVVFQRPGMPGERPVLTFLGEHTSCLL